MRRQPFIHSSDLLRLAAAFASIPVSVLLASGAERRVLECHAAPANSSSAGVYASTPPRSNGTVRARERLHGQLSQQAALYAATPAPPETRQQRRARERRRT